MLRSSNPLDPAIDYKEKGSPHTLVVTGAGLRAADITRCVWKS